MTDRPPSSPRDPDVPPEDGPPGDPLTEEAAIAEFERFQRAFPDRDALQEAADPPEVQALIGRLKAKEFARVSVEEAALQLLDGVADGGSSGATGRRLGGFEIHSVMAHGGMGVVFAGRDPALHRDVAIKALSPRLNADAASRERFRSEARAVAALDHPGILPVHSVHERGELLFFVMPLVRGATLAETVARDGPMAPARVADLALQAAGALAAAHAAGIVHRDIKPANLLLGPEAGRVRIADFGIAALDGDTGTAAGTPGFMAPEQGRDEPATPRSDLFSLGATLRFALTGKPDGPTPRRLPFGRLLDSLTAESPQDRPADADAVVEAIRRFQRRRRLLPLAAAAPAAALLIAFAPAALSPLGFYGWWNRQRAGFSDRKFHIEGRPGLYPTLLEAARAANGRVVLADFDGDRSLPMTDFGTFPVVIRAAGGRHPRFVPADPDKPMILTRAHLTLDGIRLHRPASASDPAPALLEFSHGAVTLRHCELTADEVAVPAPVIQTIDTGRLSLAGCSIDSANSPWVAVRRQRRLPDDEPIAVTVDNSRIAGVGFLIYPSAELPVAATFTRSSLAVDTGFAQYSAGTTRLAVRMEDCSIAIRYCLLWLPATPDRPMEEYFSWSGDGVRYSSQRGQADPAEFPAFVSSLDRGVIAPFRAADWHALPAVRETNASFAEPEP